MNKQWPLVDVLLINHDDDRPVAISRVGSHFYSNNGHEHHGFHYKIGQRNGRAKVMRLKKNKNNNNNNNKNK